MSKKEQNLLYDVTKGDIAKDKYWEMVNHRIKVVTKQLYNAELHNAYVREVKRRLNV